MRPPQAFPEGCTEKLQAALKRARTKGEFQRIQCLWLRAALGWNANQVAAAVGWRPTSVRRVQSRYLREGEAILQSPGRGGRRHENLSREEEQRLLDEFVTPAGQGGIMEVSQVKRAYEKAVGHPVPKSTVYRLLARHGWRKLAPRPRHVKSDAAGQQAFKKTPRNH